MATQAPSQQQFPDAERLILCVSSAAAPEIGFNAGTTVLSGDLLDACLSPAQCAAVKRMPRMLVHVLGTGEDLPDVADASGLVVRVVGTDGSLYDGKGMDVPGSDPRASVQFERAISYLPGAARPQHRMHRVERLLEELMQRTLIEAIVPTPKGLSSLRPEELDDVFVAQRAAAEPVGAFTRSALSRMRAQLQAAANKSLS